MKRAATWYTKQWSFCSSFLGQANIFLCIQGGSLRHHGVHILQKHITSFSANFSTENQSWRPPLGFQQYQKQTPNSVLKPLTYKGNIIPARHKLLIHVCPDGQFWLFSVQEVVAGSVNSKWDRYFIPHYRKKAHASLKVAQEQTQNKEVSSLLKLVKCKLSNLRNRNSWNFEIVKARSEFQENIRSYIL